MGPSIAFPDNFIMLPDQIDAGIEESMRKLPGSGLVFGEDGSFPREEHNF